MVFLPSISLAWQVESIFGFTVDSQKTPLGSFIDQLLYFIYSLSGSLILLRLVIAGYEYMSAKGNPQLVKQAKNKIWHAAEGLLIIIGAFLFAQIIGGDIVTNYLY